MRECCASDRLETGFALSQQLLKLCEPKTSSLSAEERLYAIKSIMHSATKDTRRGAEKHDLWIQAARQTGAFEDIGAIDSSDLEVACATFTGSVWATL